METSPTIPCIIELQHLTKRFGSVAAVEDLSLAVASGEFLTLLGASGSGKTTTLRMIAGFELPTSGEILMDNAPITPLPPFKRDVNTVFQHYALFPHMSVQQNVGYGLRMRGVPAAEREERVKLALEMVKLSAFADRSPRRLSGGQQQRVALARALVNRPRVLLLDEPLGALDLKLRKEMQLELKALNKRLGITFLYVTHDQEEALTMSDRIALMHGGRIAQLGTPQEIYDWPSSRYVADFIGETNLLRGTAPLASGAAAGSIVALEVGGTTLHARLARPLPPGAPAWISIRPEYIRLDAAPPNGGFNSLTGTLREVVFTGAITKAFLALPDGATLQAHVRPDGELVPGGTMQASWPIERGVCVGE